MRGDEATETLIAGALDWPTQKADFDWDGSWRDIYILDTTLDDWRAVLVMILRGGHEARMERSLDDHVLTVTETQLAHLDIASLFGANSSLSFFVSTIELKCHFFTSDQIEFDLDPRQVNENTVRHLLAFLIQLGNVTQKTAMLTPENCEAAPIYRYDPAARELRWNAP